MHAESEINNKSEVKKEDTNLIKDILKQADDVCKKLKLMIKKYGG